MTPEEVVTQIAATSTSIGPKSVDTEHIKASQFSPEQLIKLQSYADRKANPLGACDILGGACYGKPNKEAYKPTVLGEDEDGS